jgi:hypothetical protein
VSWLILKPDDVTLGIILGTALFCDETAGPFRARKLMREAPGIVLKSDAHVTDEEAAQAAPVLPAFGRHLQDVMAQEKRSFDKPEGAAA